MEGCTQLETTEAKRYMHDVLLLYMCNNLGSIEVKYVFTTIRLDKELNLLVVNSSVMVSCSSPLSLVAAPMFTSPVAAISNRQRSSSPHAALASSSSSGSENSTSNAGL